jgi:hypothetical protein
MWLPRARPVDAPIATHGAAAPTIMSPIPAGTAHMGSIRPLIISTRKTEPTNPRVAL